jgi:DNA repair exonuclease SbcCD ATPase subunit
VVEEKIGSLASDIQHIRADQNAMRSAIERMSEAVARLALIEERQSSASHAIERIIGMLTKLEDRVRQLEIAEPLQQKSSEWVDKALWAALTGALAFIIGKVL